MARQQLLAVVFCILTAAFCNSQKEEGKDRALSPPVISFMEKLKSLRTAMGVAENSPYVVPGDVQEPIGTPARPLFHQREKRHISPGIAMRGCHLGTCQLQNLASTLYRLGNNNRKNGSNRNTKDPMGYGRRRRSLTRKEQHSVAQRIAMVQRQLAT